METSGRLTRRVAEMVGGRERAPSELPLSGEF